MILLPIDNDECAQNPCGDTRNDCTNMEGGFQCVCVEGFSRVNIETLRETCEGMSFCSDSVSHSTHAKLHKKVSSTLNNRLQVYV